MTYLNECTAQCMGQSVWSTGQCVSAGEESTMTPTTDDLHCVDRRAADGTPWQLGEGADAPSCAFIGSLGLCAQFMHVPGANGLTPALACCSCGGGAMTASTEPWISSAATTRIFISQRSTSTTVPEACHDATDMAQNAWSLAPGVDCAYYARYPEICNSTGNDVGDFGLTGMQACCACDGGDVASSPATTEPPVVSIETEPVTSTATTEPPVVSIETEPVTSTTNPTPMPPRTPAPTVDEGCDVQADVGRMICPRGIVEASSSSCMDGRSGAHITSTLDDMGTVFPLGDVNGDATLDYGLVSECGQHTVLLLGRNLACNARTPADSFEELAGRRSFTMQANDTLCMAAGDWNDDGHIDVAVISASRIQIFSPVYGSFGSLEYAPVAHHNGLFAGV